MDIIHELMTREAIVAGALLIGAFFGLVILAKMLIHICPANGILVISGRERTVSGKKYGFRIVKGVWTFVIPYLERVEMLDLGIIPVKVRVDGVNSANGITLGADATACVCINDTDPTLLYNAVERLLGKSQREIQEQMHLTMVGNFRGALNGTTPLQAIGMVDEVEAEKTETGVSVEETAEVKSDFRDLLLKDCMEDLSSFGVKVVSVSLQRIWDTSQYIANLADKTLSSKRREVQIEEAKLRAMAERAESDSERRVDVSKSNADRKILEARRQLEILKQKCDGQIRRAKLEADSTIVGAKNEAERKIQEITVKLQELRNRSNVVLESEANRERAEILAEGDAEATRVVQSTKNALLQRRVGILAEAGDYGKIALFMAQLPHLFTSFEKHGRQLKVDNLLITNEADGFNEAVNRGPRALVDFVERFEQAFGVSIKSLLTPSADNGGGAVAKTAKG